MRKIITILLVYSGMSLNIQAQPFDFWRFRDKQNSQKENLVKFDYRVNFEYNLDNREFDVGKNLYTNSMTINAARLTPQIGFKVNDKSMTHNVMLGIDVLKNMGESPVSKADRSLENSSLLRELLLYYNVKAKSGKALISGYAGVFPRSFSVGEYDNAFYSDSLRFYDNNIEGVLLNVISSKAVYEIGLDWMGQYGRGRRERFLIFSSGNIHFNTLITAGWSFFGYHLANMVEYGGVVDNILASPFIKLSLGRNLWIQDFSVKLSYLQGFQRDRLVSSKFVFPKGGQIDLRIMNWNTGIENKLYIGKSLMPYYNKIDAGGNKYGSLLYFGDPFYRIFHNDKTQNAVGLYDRLELFYQPHISDFIDLKISIMGHFATNENGKIGFMGSRQKLSLIFNLEKWKNKTRNNKTY